jgi:hypothetical protein
MILRLRYFLIFQVILTISSLAADFVASPYLSNAKTDGVTIAWITEQAATGKVEFGESTSYGTLADAPKSETVNSSKGGYAFKKSSMVVSKVRIRGLQPGKKYFYKVSVEGLPAYENYFFTAPVSHDVPVCIAFLGDSYLPDDADVAHMEAKAGKPIDFYIDVGDHVVARFGDPKDSKKWMGRIPTYIARGNHDNEGNHGGELEAIFDFDDNKLTFPVNWGPLFLICDGSSIYRELKDDSFKWLDEQYAQAKQPWKAYSCHGIFFSDSDHGLEGPSRVAQFWPLFRKHGIQFEISGHDHDYQRTDRVDQEGKPDPKGVLSVTFGGNSPDFHRQSPWAAYQWPPTTAEERLAWVKKKAKKKGKAFKDKAAELEEQQKDGTDTKSKLPQKSVKSLGAGERHAVAFMLIKGDTTRLELWTGSGDKRTLSDSYEIKLP